MSLNDYSLKRLTSKLKHFPLLKDINAVSILNGIPFFSGLEDLSNIEVMDSIHVCEFYQNQVICRHGTFNENCHIILSGKVKAVIPTENISRYELYTLGPGKFFGEEIIISDEPCMNTIEAETETITLSIPKETLQKLVNQSGTLKSIMDKQYIERKLRYDLRRVSIFSHLNNDLFNEMLGRVELITFPEDTVIFNEGDEGDAFYFIRKGRVRISKVNNGKDKLIAVLGEGQFFGEMSLLLKEARSGTARVLKASELVKISREGFINIVNQDQELGDKFQKIIETRLTDLEDIFKNPDVAVVTRKILDLNMEINKHLDIIYQCTVETVNGSALLASFPGMRYPYIYPRDSSCASRFLYKLVTSPFNLGENAFMLLSEMAKFILHCQREDGFWGQRYGIEGEDKSIYLQEDNVAHGVTILCRYLLAAKYRGIKIQNPEHYINAICKGAEYANINYFRNDPNLFYSTTSIHESAIEKGYSIWVNYSYLLMCRLIVRVSEAYGVSDKLTFNNELIDKLEASIEKYLVSSGRYVRMFKSSRVIDYRPDITMLSPFFFGTGMDIEYFRDSEQFINSVRYIEDNLWDNELGMLQRYPADYDNPHVHVHAGNGPWVQYTAILAQYYYYKGDIKRGDEILNLISSYASKEGYLSEHLTKPERFFEFLKLEWTTCRDFQKELLDNDILIPGIPCDFIVEELNHMKKAYDTIEKECREIGDKGYIHFVSPLMWSHAEYGMALLMKTEKELESIGDVL
jgi:CRP-like cAMP-binding protein